MPSVREDVFPATVLIASPDFATPIEELTSHPPTPGAVALSITRVIVTSGRVLIARDGAAGPVIVFSEAIDPSSHYKAPRDVDSWVTTVTGKKIVFRKDTTCGCGSRLKSWRPFASSSSVKDPTE